LIDFDQVMGTINLAPLLGGEDKGTVAFLPLCLIVLCALHIFNVYNWLFGCCCFKRFRKFVYDEDFSDERIDQGRDIIAQGFIFENLG
jgi:hypothetical protein